MERESSTGWELRDIRDGLAATDAIRVSSDPARDSVHWESHWVGDYRPWAFDVGLLVVAGPLKKVCCQRCKERDCEDDVDHQPQRDRDKWRC